MNFNEVMNTLKELGTEQNRKIYTNHGADIDMYGVSIANLKKVLKKIKKNTELGKQLLFSKNIDAMYLSQWVVDPKEIRLEELENILMLTDYYMIIDNVVAPIAVKNKDNAYQALDRWLHHSNHRFRQSAYSLFCLMMMSYNNEELDLELIKTTLEHVKNNIHNEQNRVRYSMNSFVINAGVYIESLTEECKAIGTAIGKVEVSMGKTACKVPSIVPYINKVETMGKIGYKRKVT